MRVDGYNRYCMAFVKEMFQLCQAIAVARTDCEVAPDQRFYPEEGQGDASDGETLKEESGSARY